MVIRNHTGYNNKNDKRINTLIRNFLHKGIKKFYISGSVSGIQKVHEKKLQMILARLEVIQKPEDMNLPGFNFHSLTGNRKGQYAVCVQKNWRVVFKFDGVDVYDVDYLDYH